MIMNMPTDSFFLYYVGYFVQAAIVVALGFYWHFKDKGGAKNKKSSGP
ncbi:MAG: hypothetical protein ACOX7R_01370 [Acetivibrionales bacterium]